MDEQRAQRERRSGVLQGLGAYGIWGFFPVFWKALGHVPALEVLFHRVVWSFVLLLIAAAIIGRWRYLVAAVTSRRILGVLSLTTLLIAVNWLVFIWAVNSGHVLESSLGYFINPLVNVLLGMVFLRERLNRWQAVAVALAAAGVIVLTVAQGQPPWVSLILAFTFGFYGLLRKRCSVDAIVGLTVETAILTPVAALYLAYLAVDGQGMFGTDRATDLLLVVGGAVTAVPLLLFAGAARRLRYVTVGLLQYIAPTMHFILAVSLYGEPLTSAHLITFACIWGGLLLYVGDALFGRPQVKTA